MHAVAVHPADHHIEESSIWFVLLLSEPYTAVEDMLDSTDKIEKGWLVVDVYYYSRVQRSPRGYQLHKHKRTLVVNSLIRLPKPVEFERPLRQSRSAVDPNANPLRMLLDPAFHAIESSMQAV